ncbi:MAG TPA: hypothetical protein VE155_06525 [Pseudonocardiaceae bacterium]|nr:hypothetical protein [Pseudonocardiaceae bacterium]
MIDTIKIKSAAVDDVLTALLDGSPVSAARYGLLTFAHGLAEYSGDALVAATAPLRAELGVDTMIEIPAALAALPGRAPRRVSHALRSRELISALVFTLEESGHYSHADLVRQWLMLDLQAGDLAYTNVTGVALTQRQELVDQLMARVAEITAGWQAKQIRFNSSQAPSVDGRAMVAAARAWQVAALSPKSILSSPTSASAKHANRLGRTAAAVAASRLGTAYGCPVWVLPVGLEEPLALLIAVAEAVLPAGQPAATRTGAPVRRRQGSELEFSVKLGAPVDRDALAGSMSGWWPVLDSWGSCSRDVAGAMSTAWRLSPAQGDVVVWALCSAACRLAVSAMVTGAGDDPRLSDVQGAAVWAARVAEFLPSWEAGATRVWTLLHQARRPGDRGSWPGCVFPALDDPSSWPWRPLPDYDEPSTDTLTTVPSHEEESHA